MSKNQSAEQQGPGEGDKPENGAEREGSAAPSPEELQIDSESPGAEQAVGEADPENAVAAEEHQSPEAEIARLSEELDAARAKADEHWQKFVRAEAEKENIRKRAEKDADTARKQGVEKLAGELLSVRDSLELGLEAAQQEDADIEKIREGTELTLKMLVQAMEKFEIEEIDPTGEKFDPEYHQAMSMQEIEGQESNTVVSVMQKGYRLGDRLLRPALVMVAK